METAMLATIRRIRDLFARRGCEPSAKLVQLQLEELARLQMHLDATWGGGLAGCGCGGVITPIVHTFSDHWDVVALACTRCHSVAALEKSGTVATAAEIAEEVPTGAIVH
jgi:hypothetical protein